MTFFLLAIFGVAMAHFEGVVVVYLRKAIGLDVTDLKSKTIADIPKRIVLIEKTREAATIIMLVCIALLVGEGWFDQSMIFLWTFAFWDLFYYVSLYLTIKWPPKLTTMDVLFLIPRPWIAPVWFPIGVSTLTILLVLIFYIL